MRAVIGSVVLLAACAPSHQPDWVQDEWAAEPLYFRTIGEITPVAEVDDADATPTSAGATWTGFEEWRIEDVDGAALCTVRWASSGLDAGFDCGADCDVAWDLVCHSGVQDGDCATWFDPDTITMSSALDVAWRADEGAVYMRSDVSEPWSYQAAGALEGRTLRYDERFAF